MPLFILKSYFANKSIPLADANGFPFTVRINFTIRRFLFKDLPNKCIYKNNGDTKEHL